MSDIRFNGWLHRSGTGGVWQDSSGNVGIGSSVPSNAAVSANTKVLNVGIVTAAYYYGSGANLTNVGVDGITSSADGTAITIDSSERVLIGHTASDDRDGYDSALQVSGTGGDDSSISIGSW